MAVTHATRPRAGILGAIASTIALPGTARPGVARPGTARPGTGAGTGARRRTRVTVGAGRRSDGRVGLVLGAIIVAFLLAFFSLAQTVRVSAAGYDIERLLTERSRLQGLEREAVSDLNRVGREPGSPWSCPATRRGRMRRETATGTARMTSVLIVEDDGDIRAMLARGLSAEGFAVDLAGGVDEALARSEEHTSELQSH